MTSLSPVVGPTGISSPDFSTILSSLQASFLSIYGSDAVLTPDSQDGQFVSILAQAIYDQGQALIAIYNSFSPATAQGAGLSSVAQINGIARDVSTSSTALVAIVGQANSVITNGQVGDNLGLGTVWNLPASVTIPSAGTITVTATSAATGATAAAAGTLTQILTPTLGWQSVTNAAAATVGAPVETDAALRQRQAVSTAIAAQTPVNSILAAVANVPGVSNALVIQNDTDVVDANGLPEHSIAVIVAGGDPTAIAQTIALTKPPGIQTVGTTNVVVLDGNGVPNLINFFVQTQTSIFGSITLAPNANFNPSTSALIIGAVVQFINSLGGNQNVLVGKLFSPANLNGDAATGSSGMTQQQLDQLSATYNIPINGIQIGLSSGALSTADIILSVFTEAETLPANWTVTT